MIVVPRFALHVVALAVAVALLLPIESQAQSADGSASASTPDSTCSYRSCALAIVPRWNGLALIQGTSGPQVANLNFFWPHPVARALAGGSADEARDSMAAHANRALGLRRAGAVLTDAGLGAAVLVGTRLASRGRVQRDDKAIGAAGLASMLLSIPLHFAADGELSRAVWWHNARFLR